MAKPTSHLLVRCNVELRERIKAAAARDNRSAANFMRMHLERAVEQSERELIEAATKQALNNYGAAA